MGVPNYSTKGLDKRIPKKWNKLIPKVLVEWSNNANDDSLWVDLKELQAKFRKFIRWPHHHTWGQVCFVEGVLGLIQDIYTS